ncbi:MAG: radical SAM/SPASM domain-containing protein [Pseudomonadota bacterium]
MSAFNEVNKFGSFIKNVVSRKNRIKYLKYRFSWNFLHKYHLVSRFPTHIDIETTNKCNLKCIMCPHGFPTPAFKKSLGSMDVELAKKILEEGTKKGLASIKLNWRGEPLIWKEHLVDIIKYAKQLGVLDVILNTNGLLLDDKLSKELILSGLNLIVFSVDGDTSSTYETIRKGGNFNKLVHNLQKFVEIRNSLGKTKPLVRVQMVKMDKNAHEIESLIKRWTPYVESITFQDYTNRGEDENRLNTDKEGFKKIGRRPCPQIWQRIIVKWDGSVVMCCRDWESENVLGQLDYSKGLDVESFWRGNRLNKIRRLHLNKELQEISACSKCTYKESFEWQKNRIRDIEK